jgi:hypothetical protein
MHVLLYTMIFKKHLHQTDAALKLAAEVASSGRRQAQSMADS